MASKFTFRFEPILNLKEKEEEAKKTELGMAAKRLKEEEAALYELYHRKHDVASQIQEKTQGVLKVKDLQFYATKLQFVDQLINQQKVAVSKCENQVDHTRKLLIEAKKQTKIYDLLKDKEYENYNYMQQKEEEAFVDQLVSFKTACK
ncbi:flagellar export protein FliJ [Alkaliphilus crotonatoxidans]